MLESADKESADKRAISFGISGIEGKEVIANPQPAGLVTGGLPRRVP